MKISVVLTTYNRAHIIPSAIEAVLAQTRPADEIIIMDDGSTDGTAAMLQARFGDRISVFEQDNMGCEGARARAVCLAGGDWVALCDSDDTWHPTHLEDLVRLAVLRPQANLLFSNFREVGTAAVNPDKFATLSDDFWIGTTELGDGFVDLGDSSFLKILTQNPAFPSASMFRKTAYDALGGIDGSLSKILSSDADLTRRLAVTGSVACNRRITVDILKNGENISSNGIHVGLGRIAVLKKNLREGGIFAPYERQIRKAISDTACEVMMIAFWHRDMARMMEAAAEVHFWDRPFPLKVRTIVAHMPAFARNMLLGLYQRAS